MVLNYLTVCVLVLFLELEDVISLKDVKLTIEPQIVQYRNHSTIKCTYDLEEDTLYSVKWYRGQYEFYRFTPRDTPSQKVFPAWGIHVDESSSNSTQVVIRDIDFNLSGNFSCEVTTDVPHIATGIDTQWMMVIQLPEFSPTISVGRELLDVGNVLRANCSSPPSRPPVTLQFKLNDLMVAQNDYYPFRKAHERSWSDLFLELPLNEIHFDEEGRLILRCIAFLPDVYYDEVELELASARKPIPQRVSGDPNSVMVVLPTKGLTFLLSSYILLHNLQSKRN
ncbi:hypothetical protein GWI33_023372 [Rhynchophorus ferrugineus]|uniref:Ig-like domain-containing protein n=1 Tax=Rhynchophorus ferrugineus TaxID=354439 RepID=A0A834IN33_RHYFE|nr:hypothetical protein GWI33_023372 [Rhynchophorus ferrugineus]